MKSAKFIFSLLERAILELFSLIRCLPKKITLLFKLVFCNLLKLNEVYYSKFPRYISKYFRFEAQSYLRVLFHFVLFFNLLHGSESWVRVVTPSRQTHLCLDYWATNCQLRSKSTFSQDKDDFAFAYCKLFLGSWSLKNIMVLVSTKRKSKKFGLLCVQLNKNYDLSSYYFTIFLASLKIINFI